MPRIRRRIFVGCEGKGERSLAIVLQRFAEEAELSVHLDPYDTHGGDPLVIVNKSIKESGMRIAKRGIYDGGRFILLDADRESAESVTLANREGINLVRQNSCLECHLGRMLSGKHRSTCASARKDLLKLWPEYRKGFDAPTLKSKLSIDMIRSSAKIGEEWELFLQTIGFIE